MSSWILYGFGIVIVLILASIGNEIRYLSSRLDSTKEHQLSDLPEKIAKAIIWELDMNSSLPKNIHHELMVAGDLSDKIESVIRELPKEITYELIHAEGLPEKIAGSIDDKLEKSFGICHEVKTIREHLTSIDRSLKHLG